MLWVSFVKFSLNLLSLAVFSFLPHNFLDLCLCLYVLVRICEEVGGGGDCVSVSLTCGGLLRIYRKQVPPLLLLSQVHPLCFTCQNNVG